MNWFTALCNALAYWLKIQSVKAYYELTKQIDDDAEVTEYEINRLRGTGLAADALAADRLRDRFARRSGIFVPNLLTAPPTLRLPQGKPVATVEGVYTPAHDETWHSDARFRRLEQQLLDATTALNELRTHPQ